MSTSSTRIELAALWKLALPLAIAQAGQALMGIVDTAVVGRLSAAAQGGAGLGNSLTFTVIFLGMGTMLGLDPLISQAIGAGQPSRARSLYWSGLWLAGLVSIGLVLIVAVLPSVLLPFGVKPLIAQGASEFIWWRLPGLPASMLFIAARSYLQAVGRVRGMLLAMVIGNVANFALDVVLVFGLGPIPALGIAGAAIATSLSSWLQFAVLAWSLGPSPENVRRAFEWGSVKRAGAVGLPIGLHLIAESGLFSLVGLFAATLGEAAIAAHQIVLSVASFTFCVAVGIGSAGTVRVGHAVGQNDTPGARRAGFLAFGSGASFMMLSAVTFIILRVPLANAMSSQPDVIAVAASLFWVTAVFQVSDGVQAIGAGVLRGAGDTRFVFWANIVGHWLIGLPVAYGLGVMGSLGVVGLWWGLSAGLTAVGACLLVRFAALSRKHIAPLEHH